MILLTPGPCMTTETVRQAGAGQDLNHRDPAYMEMIHDVKTRLRTIYSAEADKGCEGFIPYLIGGSGTAAMEAMICSCVNQGPVLILENGYYSSRLTDIFQVHKIPHERLSFGWRDPWDLEAIRTKLKNGQYEAVFATHNETTTGRLNPIDKVGAMCREVGAKFLVDAMSSFGADPINFSDIDGICASGNKCLHGIPGVAFVMLKEQFARDIRDYPRRSYYLSLSMYEHDNPRLTPPVPALAALRQALIEMGDEKPAQKRHAEYVQRSNLIRETLHEMGFEFALPVEDMSCTLTTATIPRGWTFEAWHIANREEGYLLYETKGELSEQYFQVANMGELSLEHIREWLKVVPKLLAN